MAHIPRIFDCMMQDEQLALIPPKRNTKLIGDISELMVMAALVKAGYLLYIPFGENHRSDVIAEKDDKFHRIQIKTGRVKNGAVLFNCCSTHGHRNGPSSRSYIGEIDFLAVYCPERNETYLIPECAITRTKGSLRFLPTANHQQKGVRWAESYAL